MTEDDIVLAGELVLGVLDGEERAAVLRRTLVDVAFAREVERWRGQLDGLHGAWPEEDPGTVMEHRALSIADGRGNGNAGRSIGGVWPGWRWVAGIAGAAAAAMLIFTVLRPTNMPVTRSIPAVTPAPTLVAVLQPKDATAVSVVIDPGHRTAQLNGSLIVPAGRVAELWLIGGDGVPQAAGLAPNGTGRLALRPGVVPSAGITLAVSIEPLGGSPKATPTGSVIATGTLAFI